MSLLGIEIIFPDDPTKGDRLIFENTLEINGINIPRIRHWFELRNNDYSGSDMIMKEITA